MIPTFMGLTALPDSAIVTDFDVVKGGVGSESAKKSKSSVENDLGLAARKELQC